MHPESTERIHNECKGGRKSNVLALFKDSMDLLTSSENENLTLIGKITSPRETSVGKPGLLKRFWTKVLRLPPYKSQHYSFVAVKVDIPEAIKAIRTMVAVYTQNKGVFENQQVFVNAAIDLFAHYEQKSRLPSRGLLGVGNPFNSPSASPESACTIVHQVDLSRSDRLNCHFVFSTSWNLQACCLPQVPESTLVPALHPRYATLSTPDRLRELKDSAMSQFFRHTWTLIFSVSANNILNAAHLDGLEKTFSTEAWRKSNNDPFQVGSATTVRRSMPMQELAHKTACTRQTAELTLGTPA